MTNLPVTDEFQITATYGQQGPHWASGHKGIDFYSENDAIYSTCDGTVRVVAFDNNGWGQYVSIGDNEGNRHIFCHLASGSVKVKVGDKVNRLTVIGRMGSTGNSTGIHLHYQINNKNNIPIDPTSYLGIPNRKGTYKSEQFEIKEGHDLADERITKFNDENEMSDYAKKYIKLVSDEGIMVGNTNDNFMPKSNLTREDAAVIIGKILERI